MYLLGLCWWCLVAESELLDRIKKNKVSKAIFLMQKAFLAYNTMEPNRSNQTQSLLEVTHSQIFKLEIKCIKLDVSTCTTVMCVFICKCVHYTTKKSSKIGLLK